MAKSKKVVCIWAALLLGVVTAWAGGDGEVETAWLEDEAIFAASSDPDGGCIASGETRSGTISPGGDNDAYTFYGEAGQGVVIEMADNSSTGDLDPRVQLHGPNGARVDDSWDFDRATMNRQLEIAGIYTIVASDGRSDVDTGAYGLSMVLTGSTTTCLQDRDGGDMTPTEARSGTITPGGDLDAYAFYGRTDQRVTIEMGEFSTTPALQPKLELYDPNGVRVTYSWGFDRATIEDWQLKITGIYTVVASDDSPYVTTGEYGLAVAVMPPKGPYGVYPYAPQPSDGNTVSVCGPDTLTLSWWPVTGATGYDVYFASGPCMPLERVAQNVVQASVLMPALEPTQPYCYWRVVAHTPGGDIQGPTWWFAVECLNAVLTTSSTEGGAVIVPGEGTFTCAVCEDVNVVAQADAGYRFVRWTGAAADPNSPSTTVKVCQNTSVRAEFEPDCGVVYDLPLDSDPGWARNGQWAYGVPTGRGGTKYGNPDPTSGHTGQNVLGVNLNGDYDTAIGGSYSLVAGPFDLRDHKNVKLSFWRWLNTDEPGYVTATVDMSINGNDWRTLWESRTEITDSRWTLVEYPLGVETDGQPAVYVRWTCQILRERAYPYSGWNLDDIQLSGCRQ